MATGPPRQATGPLGSGAGVGVGMLRGAGDSLTDVFLDFDDLSRFQHRKIQFFWKALGEIKLNSNIFLSFPERFLI